MTVEPPWVDAAEAARLLGVKPTTLYSYVSRGLLHRRRHPDGRRSLFDPAEVEALRRGRHPTPAEAQLVFTSAITALGDDRPFFRGRDALALARTSSYEAVAEWLWTGTDIGPPVPWVALPAGVDAAVRAQAALPEHALPLDRLQLIVTALAVSDPLRFSLEPHAVVATGRAMVAGIVEALPLVGPEPSGESVAERLWPRLSAAAPRTELVRLLETALVLLADHELAASTVAARVAASVKADPYAVVSAALGVVGGPMHGGASLGVEEMLSQIDSAADATRVVGDRLRRGDRVPGVGHTVYKSGDGRGTLLLDLLHDVAADHPRVRVADAIVSEMHQRQLPPVNVDFAIATFAAVADMVPGAGEAIFAIARTAGWLAHALEEYTRRSPWRPRAAYVGPPPEQRSPADSQD